MRLTLKHRLSRSQAPNCPLSESCGTTRVVKQEFGYTLKEYEFHLCHMANPAEYFRYCDAEDEHGPREHRCSILGYSHQPAGSRRAGWLGPVRP